MALLDTHRAALRRLEDESRLRFLAPRTGLDFASNDYLGLATSDALRAAVSDALARGVAIGAGGSRLLRGNDPEHETLEAEAAAFFDAESALYFSSGFAANSTLFAALPDRRDLIVHDALIHASVHDGMRASFAEKISAVHNDPQSVEDAIVGWRAKGGKGRIWIAVESLYSMDGDCAPIADLAAIADRHEAFLVIDEAHAIGVFGPGGRGFAAELGARENIVRVVTCGKALGCEGALVLGSRVLIDMLVNRGRGFVFSTAPSPLMAAAVRGALQVVRDEPDRRQHLENLVRHAADRLSPLGATASNTQIIPFIIGEDGETMQTAAALQAAGFDVRGIRPPTVPPGTSRLRISITLNVTEDDITALAETLGRLRA